MTGKLAGQILQSGFLKGVRSDVLIALASVANRDGQSWYSYKALAHMSRRSRKAVIEAVKWLELREVVHVERGRNLQTVSGRFTSTTNIYTLNLPFLEALILLTEAARKATPGGADEKWAAAKRVAEWAETLVERFEWRTVVTVTEQPPQYIKQCVFGIEPPMNEGGDAK